MTVVHRLGERLGNTSANLDHGRLFDAELHGDRVGGLEPDAANVVCEDRLVADMIELPARLRYAPPVPQRGGDTGNALIFNLDHPMGAGLRIPTKAATDSDPKRPLWPGVEFGVVIVAVGCSLDVIFVRRGQRRWR